MHYDVCISIIIGCSLSVPAGWRSPIYDFIAGRRGAAEPVHRERVRRGRVHEHEPSDRAIVASFSRFLGRREASQLAKPNDPQRAGERT